METDKENQQHQMLNRKMLPMEHTSAPRTPFGAVNRQSAFSHRADVSNQDQKSGQKGSKPQSKRHSWAHECLPASKLSQAGHDHDGSLTPIRSSGLRDRSLRRRMVELKGERLTEESMRPTSQPWLPQMDQENVVGPPLTCTLPPSPILYLPTLEISRQCAPTGSASCPEVFSNCASSIQGAPQISLPQNSLPEISDNSTEETERDTGESEMVRQGTPEMDAEENELASLQITSSVCAETGTVVEEKTEICSHVTEETSVSPVEFETTVIASNSADEIKEEVKVVLSCEEENRVLVIDEQVEMQTDVQHVCAEGGKEGTSSCTEIMQQAGPVAAKVVQDESVATVQSILEEIVCNVLEDLSKLPDISAVPQQDGGESELSGTESDSLDNSTDTDGYLPLPTSIHSELYIAEYTKFVASYVSENEKLASQMAAKNGQDLPDDIQDQPLDSSSPSGVLSSTDVTSSSFVSSFVSDADQDHNNHCNTEVVLDSLGSFIFDADDSLSNPGLPNKQLLFTEGETPKSSKSSESVGFARPSVSRFDLTKESEEVPSPWKSFSDECQNQDESLELNVSGQVVAYFVSPPSTAVCPNAIYSTSSKSESKTKMLERESEKENEETASLRSEATCVDSNAVTADADLENVSLPSARGVDAHEPPHSQGLMRIDASCSPLSAPLHEKERSTETTEMTDANTMTQSVDTNTIGLSPFAVSIRERGTGTEPTETSDADTMTQSVDMSTVALSPLPLSVREKQTETDFTDTSDADTMTSVVQVFDIALSPVAVSVRTTDTMTVSPEKTETAIETETVESHDHSVLATAEMEEKTTMTDGSGSCNAHTTMTPFKTLAKQGRRPTSDDIRKQHPRTLANQLDTLTVCNTRLETDLKSTQKEQVQLKAALKQAKTSEAGIRKELATVQEEKEKDWKDKEKQYKENIHELELKVAESVGCIAGLELEASELREALEAATKRYTQGITELQVKVQTLDEQKALSEKQYEEQLAELRTAQENNSYKRQFELAQQMVREREAEIKELRGVFVDLQHAAEKQEAVHAAFEAIHEKVMEVARENKQLKKTLSEQRALHQEERARQQAQMAELEEHAKNVAAEADNLRQTMTLNNENLSELEKLYAGSSSDLLTATGQVIQLNSELHGARKAMQELLLSKEALARQASDLEEELSIVKREQQTLSKTLSDTQAKLQIQTKASEDLQKLNTKIKRLYEEKFENLELGIENLQRTLDNRETDIDNLEKDLYECRNIIVEQRYKMDDLESELKKTREEAAQRQSNDEDVQFFKESNAFLEAERALYVESLRDLEEKLKASAQEVGRQQQVTSDALSRVAHLEQENSKLQMELSDSQTLLSQSRHTLAVTEAEYSRAESVAMAAAGDLLHKMQTVLNGLRKKIGVEEVSETSAPSTHQHRRSHAPSRQKRHIRKSFVSKVLAALSPEREEAEGRPADTDRDRGATDRQNNDDVMAIMNGSGDATGTGASLFASLDSASPDKAARRGGARGCDEIQNVGSSASFRGLGLTASDLAMAYSLSREDADQPSQISARKQATSLNSSLASIQYEVLREEHDQLGARRQADHAQPSRFRSVPSLAPSQSSAFTVVQRSSSTSVSSLLNTSLPPPPPPRPPTSGVAKIRTLSRADRRSAPVGMSTGPEDDILSAKQRGFLACIKSLDEVFMEISRLASILDRATQMSLQDLREKNDILQERSSILEEQVERDQAEMEVSRQEMAAMESKISQLQERNRQMSDHMESLADHTFQVKCLSSEVKRLQGELDGQRREKEVLAGELEAVLRRIEDQPSSDGSSSQARCVRDVIALKKKNQKLLNQLEDQREHFEEMGKKAARRMRVLEENWRKAEDEVFRFDELVENIRKIAESRASAPSSSLMQILQLISGGINSSQV